MQGACKRRSPPGKQAGLEPDEGDGGLGLQGKYFRTMFVIFNKCMTVSCIHCLTLAYTIR